MHDFNPGPPASGRPFWTFPVAPSTGSVDPVAGTASYRLDDLRLKDYLFLANGVAGGPSFPGIASFDVRWSGVTRRASKVDTANRFAIDGAETGCTITWTAKRTDSGFSFVSDPASSKPGYAAVYRERNGVFLKGG